MSSSMARLPVPDSDDGNWGTLLNEFLGVAHNNDGTLISSAVTNIGTELLANKNQSGGYAGLDGSGHVASAQLPAPTSVATYMGVEASGPTITNQTFTQVAFTGVTAQLDTTSIRWDSGSPTVVSILQTGVYSVTAGVYWRDAGLTGPITLQIISSCQFNFADIRPAIGDGVTESQQFLTATMYLQTGQEINLYIEQSTGATLTPYINMLVTRCA
jgi:hypothetical protein